MDGDCCESFRVLSELICVRNSCHIQNTCTLVPGVYDDVTRVTDGDDKLDHTGDSGRDRPQIS